MKIIDGHVHIGKATWCHIDADVDLLIRAADRNGIEKLFVTDFLALTYDMAEGNEFLRTQIPKYPGRLYGYYTVSAGRFGPWIVDQLDRYVNEYGFRGLKIYSVPPLQVIDDPYMIPVIAKAAELRIPILAHSTGPECESLARRVPDAVIINAHMGCCPQAQGDWHRSIAAAQMYPNIYLDTASSSFDNNMIETAVAEAGAEKIVYGSDLPLLDPALQIAKILESDITPAQKEMILSGNILRLLSLRDN
ncbi:MAG: amidohydrolase family protein [bacterium]